MESFLAWDEGVHGMHSWAETSPTVAIIETIAHYECTDPNQVSQRLAEPLDHYIDTDALERLVRHDPQPTIAFALEDYYVCIHSDTVSITPQDATTEPPQ